VLRTLYPADRAIFSTGVNPESLIAIRRLAELKSNDGNVVVRVRPGGTGFRIEATSSKDESDEVFGSFGPFECESRVQRPLDPVGQNATRRGMRSRGRTATLGVMTICGGRELLRVFNDRRHYTITIDSPTRARTFCPCFERGVEISRVMVTPDQRLLDSPQSPNRLESRDSALLGLLRQFHAELGSGPVVAGGMG
jgi:hypothetical protein